jgi:hypothetical protein
LPDSPFCNARKIRRAAVIRKREEEIKRNDKLISPSSPTYFIYFVMAFRADRLARREIAVKGEN